MTGQFSDTMVHGRHSWSVQAEPLRPWLRAHPDINREFRLSRRITANLRGYTATWGIDRGAVLLVGLRARVLKCPAILGTELPLFASWISGDLALLRDEPPKGGKSKKRLPGDVTIREKPGTLAILSIDAGRVVGERRCPVRVQSHIGGLIITYDGPEFAGIAGDDSFWGISCGLRSWTGEVTSMGRGELRLPNWDRSNKRLFDDGADRWGLRAMLLRAGLQIE
jgi:hypothetical protein